MTEPVQRPINEVFDRIREIAADKTLSPLEVSSPDTLTALFDADPTTLTDAMLTTLVRELRRRRDAFAAQEAAEAAKGKTRATRPGAIPASVAAALDKPVGEVSIEDLDL